MGKTFKDERESRDAKREELARRQAEREARKLAARKESEPEVKHGAR